MKKLLLICLSIYFLTPLFSNEYDGLLIHDYTFCPEKNNVFNIIVKKQNLNDDDLAPKTIIVKKGIDDATVDLVIDKINKNTNSRDKRKKHFKTIKDNWKLEDCNNIKKA